MQKADYIRKLKIKNMDRIAAYRRQLYENPRLRDLFIEVTSRCNAHCDHCGSRCDSRVQPDEVTAEALKNTLLEISRAYDPQDILLNITGGEPLVHSDLYKFLKVVRTMGKKIRLDTNGSMPAVLDDLIGANLVDFVSMDIKAPLTAEDYAMTSYAIVDPEDIEKSIEIIMDSGIDYEFTTTVVPIHITEDDIESICASIKGAKCYRINQFKPGSCLDPTLNQISPYKQKTIMNMVEIAKKYVKKVTVSGF